jgi:stage V sporulation protein SpoVS
MSVNLPSHYAQQFATNIQLLLQQKGSKLRHAVTVGSYKGEQAAVVDQIGAVAMQAVSGRFAAMGRVDAAVDRRWVLPSDFDLPQLIDSFDKLRLLTDPNSAYVQNAVYAAGRQMDDLIVDAFFGTAKTGKSGSTSTVFDTTYTVTAASGLTVAALITAKKMLMENEVDLDNDPIYCAITAEQHEELMSDTKIVSTDYNSKPVLVDGKLQSFYGVNFIHIERLDASGSDRLVPMWAKSGMHLGIWNDISTDISQRKDLQGLPWQSYVYMTAGATRLEEKKVIKILSAE